MSGTGHTRIKALGVTGSHTSRELRAIQCGQGMQDEQIATAISFSSAINACAKAFLWQRSIHLLTEMQLNGFSRTQTLAHTRCSMMFHQIRTWMSMSTSSSHQLTPWILGSRNTIAFNAALSSCAMGALGAERIKSFVSFVPLYRHWTPFTIILVIVAGAQWQAALGLFAAMANKKLQKLVSNVFKALRYFETCESL